MINGMPREIITTPNAPSSPLYSQAVLAAAGATMDDIVEVGVLLVDPADFSGLNEEYGRWFVAEPPARYVAKLGVELAGLLVSIRMTAYLGG